MRVAVITPVIRPGGGPAGYVHNWSRAVQSYGHVLQHHYTFHGRKSDLRTLEFQTGLKAGGGVHTAMHALNKIVRGRVRLARDWTAQWQAFERQARALIEDSDVVVFQSFQPLPLIRWAKAKGKRLIYMPHSPTPTADERSMMAEAEGRVLPAWEHEQLIRLEAEIISMADGVVFPSPGATIPYRDAFQAHTPVLKRISYVVSGVAEPDAGPGLAPANETVTVAFAGRYLPHKGFDIYCDAAEIVAHKRSNVEFVGLGSGPLPAASPVRDFGWDVSPHALLSTTSLVVVANRVAYYDLLPLECAALARPMVMTPVGGNIDQAALLPDVILAKSTKPLDVAAAIEQSLDRLRDNPTYGKLNRVAFQRYFSLEAFARAWDRTLGSVLRGVWDE